MVDLGFTDEEMITLAIEVWRGFLGQELIPLFESPDELPPEPRISACVTLKSSWYGGVMVSLPLPLGMETAKAVLGIDEPDQADLRDVIGELANMLAGRLKYHLPAGTQISLPMVATGELLELSIPGGQVAMSLGFMVDGMPVRVRIVCAEEGGQA